MRTIVLSFVIGVAASLTPLSSTVGQMVEEPAPQVRLAAEARLSEFLNLIPPGQEAAYGFHSRSEFRDATTGEPFRVFTIEESEKQPEPAQIKPLDEWRVPIIARGESRALLTVARTGNQWQAVDFGASVLARELSTCEARHIHSPRILRRGILRLYKSSCDLLLLYDPHLPLITGSVIPLESARRALRQRGLPVVEVESVHAYLPVLRTLSAVADGQRH